MSLEEIKSEEQPKVNLEFSVDNVKELPSIITCVVTDLTLTTASKVFGESAKNQEQQVLKIVVENDSLNFKRVIPINFYGFETIPHYTAQGKIIKKYGGLKVGTKLEVAEKENSNGFYKVVV